MENNFRAVSISYKTAPLQVREMIALNEQECKLFLNKAKESFDLTELLVLSTCNRTEIYYVSTENIDAELLKLLCIQKGLFDTSLYLSYMISLTENDALRHLFSVSMGLHSQVVGDIQIINQVKNAYQWTADEAMAGPFIHRLLHSIFYTNKRVIQETSFRDGAASVSYATVELVEHLVAEYTNPNILVVGLGEIGADVVRNFQNTSISSISLCNRTLSRSEVLANECGYQITPFENLWQAVEKADVIISSVNLPDPLFTISALIETPIVRHKFFIDLSVPRSVNPNIEEVPGCLVYNIDTIQNKANQALEIRKQAIPKVESIVEEALNDFLDWTKEMLVSPTIQKLKNSLEQIRQEEIARHIKGMSEDEIKTIDIISKNMMQKIIKMPVLQLKAACKRGEAETLIDVLNDLFNLETTSEIKHS